MLNAMAPQRHHQQSGGSLLLTAESPNKAPTAPSSAQTNSPISSPSASASSAPSSSSPSSSSASSLASSSSSQKQQDELHSQHQPSSAEAEAEATITTTTTTATTATTTTKTTTIISTPVSGIQKSPSNHQQQNNNNNYQPQRFSNHNHNNHHHNHHNHHHHSQHGMSYAARSNSNQRSTHNNHHHQPQSQQQQGQHHQQGELVAPILPANNELAGNQRQPQQQQAAGPPYYVDLHVNAGECVSLQLLDGQEQLVAGPATVTMISQHQNPPVPIPVQVPPGHMIHQIADENGTLKHIILSIVDNGDGTQLDSTITLPQGTFRIDSHGELVSTGDGDGAQLTTLPYFANYDGCPAVSTAYDTLAAPTTTDTSTVLPDSIEASAQTLDSYQQQQQVVVISAVNDNDNANQEVSSNFVVVDKSPSSSYPNKPLVKEQKPLAGLSSKDDDADANHLNQIAEKQSEQLSDQRQQSGGKQTSQQLDVTAKPADADLSQLDDQQQLQHPMVVPTSISDTSSYQQQQQVLACNGSAPIDLTAAAAMGAPQPPAPQAILAAPVDGSQLYGYQPCCCCCYCDPEGAVVGQPPMAGCDAPAPAILAPDQVSAPIGGARMSSRGSASSLTNGQSLAYAGGPMMRSMQQPAPVSGPQVNGEPKVHNKASRGHSGGGYKQHNKGPNSGGEQLHRQQGGYPGAGHYGGQHHAYNSVVSGHHHGQQQQFPGDVGATGSQFKATQQQATLPPGQGPILNANYSPAYQNYNHVPAATALASVVSSNKPASQQQGSYRNTESDTSYMQRTPRDQGYGGYGGSGRAASHQHHNENKRHSFGGDKTATATSPMAVSNQHNRYTTNATANVKVISNNNHIVGANSLASAATAGPVSPIRGNRIKGHHNHHHNQQQHHNNHNHGSSYQQLIPGLRTNNYLGASAAHEIHSSKENNFPNFRDSNNATHHHHHHQQQHNQYHNTNQLAKQPKNLFANHSEVAAKTQHINNNTGGSNLVVNNTNYQPPQSMATVASTGAWQSGSKFNYCKNNGLTPPAAATAPVVAPGSLGATGSDTATNARASVKGNQLDVQQTKRVSKDGQQQKQQQQPDESRSSRGKQKSGQTPLVSAENQKGSANQAVGDAVGGSKTRPSSKSKDFASSKQQANSTQLKVAGSQKRTTRDKSQQSTSRASEISKTNDRIADEGTAEEGNNGPVSVDESTKANHNDEPDSSQSTRSSATNNSPKSQAQLLESQVPSTTCDSSPQQEDSKHNNDHSPPSVTLEGVLESPKHLDGSNKKSANGLGKVVQAGSKETESGHKLENVNVEYKESRFSEELDKDAVLTVIRTGSPSPSLRGPNLKSQLNITMRTSHSENNIQNLKSSSDAHVAAGGSVKSTQTTPQKAVVSPAESSTTHSSTRQGTSGSSGLKKGEGKRRVSSSKGEHAQVKLSSVPQTRLLNLNCTSVTPSSVQLRWSYVPSLAEKYGLNHHHLGGKLMDHFVIESSGSKNVESNTLISPKIVYQGCAYTCRINHLSSDKIHHFRVRRTALLNAHKAGATFSEPTRGDAGVDSAEHLVVSEILSVTLPNIQQQHSSKKASKSSRNLLDASSSLAGDSTSNSDQATTSGTTNQHHYRGSNTSSHHHHSNGNNNHKALWQPIKFSNLFRQCRSKFVTILGRLVQSSLSTYSDTKFAGLLLVIFTIFAMLLALFIHLYIVAPVTE